MLKSLLTAEVVEALGTALGVAVLYVLTRLGFARAKKKRAGSSFPPSS